MPGNRGARVGRSDPRRSQNGPQTDLGPRQRLLNGSAVVGYRADPERPSAPAIRAARAFVRYEHMGLDKPAYLAAERIAVAAEVCEGAKEREGNSVKSAAFWDRGGPTIAALEAARTLREVSDVLGRRGAYAVVMTVVEGSGEHVEEARRGLEILADWWGL